MRERGERERERGGGEREREFLNQRCVGVRELLKQVSVAYRKCG